MEYRRYNTKNGRNKIIRNVSVIFVLLLWGILTLTGLVKSLYLPSPVQVIGAFHDVGLFPLVKHTLATIFRVIIGFSSGSLLGIFLGLLMSYSSIAENLLYNIIESWRPVPPVALIPFFILWFGFSEFGKILLVAIGCALIMVVNTYEAVLNVRPIYKRAAYSLGANELGVFKTVVIHAIIPELKSGLRISLASSISLVIISEFMGADYGLGYLINISKITFSTQTIFLGIIIIGFISWFLDFILTRTIDRLTLWQEKSKEAIK